MQQSEEKVKKKTAKVSVPYAPSPVCVLFSCAEKNIIVKLALADVQYILKSS